MKPCRQSHDSLIGRFTAVYIFPFIAFAIAIAGVYIGLTCFLSKGISNSLILIKCIISFSSLVLAVQLMFFSNKCYIMETQKYALGPNGITLHRGRKVIVLTWNQIKDVAIVAFAASASRQRYQTVVCCFIRERDQKFFDKILNSYIYGAVSTDKFIIIDYSIETMEEFLSLYPHEILDCRKMQLQA